MQEPYYLMTLQLKSTIPLSTNNCTLAQREKIASGSQEKCELRYSIKQVRGKTYVNWKFIEMAIRSCSCKTF
jgi:hypothetical protein